MIEIHVSLFILILLGNVGMPLPQSIVREGRKHLHRQGENDSRVLLSRY